MSDTAKPYQVSKTRPFGLFEWMVARRYLGATRSGSGVSLISIIAFLGIMLAVAVLITVMAVMQGFRAKLLDQLLGLNGHVFVESRVSSVINDYDVITNELRAAPSVTQAMPIIQSYVYATSQYGEDAALIYGIRPDDLRSIELVNGEEHLLDGTLDDFGEGRKGGNKIAMSIGLANKLGVRTGDFVTIVTGNGVETPMGTSPIRDKDYEVGALFRIGISEIDRGLIYMPLEQAQIFFRRGDGVDKIEIRVDRPLEIKTREEAIAALVGDSAYTYNWQDVHESYFNALQIERGMIRLVLSLIVLIAVLNIITGLVMLVKDKTADIAVMRTIGATRGNILRIFFLSGSLIGVLATLSGIILGVLLSLNIASIEKFFSNVLGVRLFNPDIYLFEDVPVEVQTSEVLFVASFALICSFLSTLYPAWRAAKLDPVEALRYE